jgi:serine protease Do
MESGQAPFATPPVLPGTPDVATLAATVTPSVVNITATQEIRMKNDDGAVDPFEFFFGARPHGGSGDEVMKRRGLGSGFILDAQGHVVTNAHVVEDATTVRVTLADGRDFEASVRGRDPRLDLAVLEIKDASKKELPYASLGSSDALRVGEYVVAIGNPFGLGDTVTMGIVSAKSREIGAGPYDDFIQTDASINPGNSGGPLFDLKGQVVGINTAMAVTGRGIGFAIPIDALKDVLPQLLTTGKVARGRLGIEIQPMDQTLATALGRTKWTGALVGDVEKDGPAARAGIKPGEVIESIDNVAVEHARDLPRLIGRHAPGAHVSLSVSAKDNTHRTVDVTLDELRDQTSRPTAAPPSTPATPKKRDFGLEIGDDGHGGTVVRGVAPESNAAELVEPGDTIVEVNSVPVRGARDAADKINATADGKPVLLKVRRGDRTRFVGLERE